MNLYLNNKNRMHWLAVSCALENFQRYRLLLDTNKRWNGRGVAGPQPTPPFFLFFSSKIDIIYRQLKLRQNFFVESPPPTPRFSFFFWLWWRDLCEGGDYDIHTCFDTGLLPSSLMAFYSKEDFQTLKTQHSGEEGCTCFISISSIRYTM